MIKELIIERNLPPLRSRDEMLEILLNNEYGHIPNIDYSTNTEEPTVIQTEFPYDNMEASKVKMTVYNKYGSHSFNIYRYLRIDDIITPFIIFISSSKNSEMPSFPADLIHEYGFQVLIININEVSSDNSDFTDGLGKVLMPNGQDDPSICGKFGLWCFAAMRAMDYAQNIPSLCISQGAVLGHSRLGKTALMTGMTDTRFRYTLPCGSGCGGMALNRGNLGVTGKKGPAGRTGETIRDITGRFGYWFCRNFARYSDSNIPEDFDQHYAAAVIAPRFISCGCADLDDWADPDSSMLCLAAASEMWEKEYGVPGLIHNDRMFIAGDSFPLGRAACHRNSGGHSLSKSDWIESMKFIRLHENDNV